MCTAPACGPSRASLLTGRHPQNTGLYCFQDRAGRESFASCATLPEYFRNNGYTTFASGKIHHKCVRVHGCTQAAVDASQDSDEPDPCIQIPRADREWSVNHVEAIRQAPYSHQPCREDSVDWHGGRGNYSLRDEEWRYTRYFDGDEELYNHQKAPYEWENLADARECADIKARFAELLPKTSEPTVKPRKLSCWADQDLDDMEHFREKVWPGWVGNADPPLV